jgi:diaminopimelate epimerase
MTGSGNDFLFLDGRATEAADWPADRIRAACDRRRGVGADGLVILSPVEPDVVRMTFFNNDGSRAAMCGNAALCSARFAARLELADPAGMTLLTDEATYSLRCVGPGHLAELRVGEAQVPVEVGIPAEPGEAWIRLGTVGVPHLVALVQDVAAVDLPVRGAALRHAAAAGAAGANANFVSRISGPPGPGQAPGEPAWAIRTFERGVEGETLACGTGTVAAALALAATGQDRLPIQFRTAGGPTLAVDAQLQGDTARDVWLCGEGRLVATGVWLE